jgi:hypothetical protein
MDLCLPKMSLNICKCKVRKTITLIGCGLLVLISLITFQQQIPTILQSSKVYDKEYIDVLRRIGDLVPENEILATSESYPQVAYFTDHKVKFTRPASGKALVEFMWKTNSSYLLVPYHTPEPNLDNTPPLIQFVEKPLEKVLNQYDTQIGKQKPDNIPLTLHQLSKKKVFETLFKKIYEHSTKDNKLILYHLRPNISPNTVIDDINPIVFVTYPINGTKITSESDILRINVTGNATDSESKIKKVEVSVDGLVFQSANPKAPGDWSTWSSSHIVTSEGTKQIVARATDNADNKRLFPLYITVK